jgi:hypothetical protein
VAERLRLRTEGLEWRSVEGEVIAIDVPQARYLGANRSASLLWTTLERGATERELAELLVDQYAIDRPVAERDVAEFVADLEAKRLLAEREG